MREPARARGGLRPQPALPARACVRPRQRACTGGAGRPRAPPAAPGPRRPPQLAASRAPAGRGAALAGLRPLRRLPQEPGAHRGERPDGGERRVADQDPALRQAQVNLPARLVN